MLDSGEGIREVRSEVVTGNYFDVLGLRPALGRFISPEDDRPGSEFAMVVGHRFWQTTLAGDPNVLGRTLRMSPAVDPPVLSPAVFRVVGVAPEEFSGTAIGEPPDVFLPMRALPVLNESRHRCSSSELLHPSNHGAAETGRQRRGGQSRALEQVPELRHGGARQ